MSTIETIETITINDGDVWRSTGLGWRDVAVGDCITHDGQTWLVLCKELLTMQYTCTAVNETDQT